jgi:hypothetical protein
MMDAPDSQCSVAEGVLLVSLLVDTGCNLA